jgi:hypothetical protein
VWLWRLLSSGVWCRVFDRNLRTFLRHILLPPSDSFTFLCAASPHLNYICHMQLPLLARPTLLPWRWRRYVPLKCQYSVRQNTVITWKTALHIFQLLYPLCCIVGYAAAWLVEALCYKLESRGFNSWWGHWIFNLPDTSSLIMTLGSTQSLNRNECQESSCR